jgi:saccharopine dehydrogenase (NAD+, L-lysine-forming)
MLELHAEAERRGVRCLVGMGNSPGLANVLVKLCADQLLEQVEEVDIFHIHGGEEVEGPAVIRHRIRAMIDPVPLFLDGEMIEVQQLGPDGEAHTEVVDFPGVGESPVYPYPHPETITLPQHIPGLRHATNKGAIFPLSYFALTQDMVRVGACTTSPLEVNGREVVPIDFSVAHILSRRAELLKQAGVEGAAGCLKVIVRGQSGGERQTFTFSLSSRSSGAGEGTGIPAAAGAVMMALGQVEGPGVLPPEAAVSPLPLLMRALKMADALGTGMGKGTKIDITREDAQGHVTAVPLPF